MSDEAPDLEIERRSKMLFGSALRLPIAAFIAGHDTGVLSPIPVTEELGLATERYTAVRAELEHLTRAGLLARLPRPRGQRMQQYQRLPSRYWGMAAEVMAELRSMPSSRQTLLGRGSDPAGSEPPA